MFKLFSRINATTAERRATKALSLFRKAHTELLKANDVQVKVIEREEKRKVESDSRINKAQDALRNNTRALNKLAEFLPFSE